MQDTRTEALDALLTHRIALLTELHDVDRAVEAMGGATTEDGGNTKPPVDCKPPKQRKPKLAKGVARAKILEHLRKHSNGAGTAAGIAEDTGLGLSTVRATLRKLTDQGELVAAEGRNPVYSLPEETIGSEYDPD